MVLSLLPETDTERFSQLNKFQEEEFYGTKKEILFGFRILQKLYVRMQAAIVAQCHVCYVADKAN